MSAVATRATRRAVAFAFVAAIVRVFLDQARRSEHVRDEVSVTGELKAHEPNRQPREKRESCERSTVHYVSIP